MENRLLKFAASSPIFNEGDPSKAMYLVRKGAVRVFKKKGDATIEIDTIRVGQILGEMAFLDGNPRSASAEALMETEIIEISNQAMEGTLNTSPEWLKILLKTIVGRVRASTNKIKLLEQASTEYEVDQYGNRSRSFVFVNRAEIMRFSTALLLVASRYGKQVLNQPQFSNDLLFRYASQILQMGEAKVISLTEVFQTVGLLTAADKDHWTANDMQVLDRFVLFMNDQNLLEASKQRDLSARGLYILGLVVKHLADFQLDSEGFTQINFTDILKKETANGKEPFRLTELEELQKQKFIQNVVVDPNNRVIGRAKKETLLNEYRFFFILGEVENLNEKKRKVAA